MARAKKGKSKANPVIQMRKSDVRAFQRDTAEQSYRMFIVIALTTALDKYEAGTGNEGAVKHILRQLDELKADFPDAADRIDGIRFCVEAIMTVPWLSSYLNDMNSLLDEIMKNRVTLEDLAAVLDDEYDIRVDYREIQ